MKRVAIESPFHHNDPAVKQVFLNYARAAVRDSLRHAEAPIASHLLYTQEGILRDSVASERAWGIEAGFTWNAFAEAVVVYSDFGISSGMAKGITFAEMHNIPVEYRTIFLGDPNMYEVTKHREVWVASFSGQYGVGPTKSEAVQVLERSLLELQVTS